MKARRVRVIGASQALTWTGTGAGAGKTWTRAVSGRRKIVCPRAGRALSRGTSARIGAPVGKVASIVIGVGGFLGIGEKNVALNFSDIDWAEKEGDRWIVVNATKEQLQSMPAFDRNAFGPANTASDTTAPATDSTAMAPATPPAGDDTATTPTQDRAAQAPSDTGTAAGKGPIGQAEHGPGGDRDLHGTRNQRRSMVDRLFIAPAETRRIVTR